MKYTYQDLPDKTVGGIEKELKLGLTKIAVFFSSTYGFPLELFNLKITQLNRAKQLLLYMNFRNKYPKVFK